MNFLETAPREQVLWRIAMKLEAGDVARLTRCSKALDEKLGRTNGLWAWLADRDWGRDDALRWALRNNNENPVDWRWRYWFYAKRLPTLSNESRLMAGDPRASSARADLVAVKASELRVPAVDAFVRHLDAFSRATVFCLEGHMNDKEKRAPGALRLYPYVAGDPDAQWTFDGEQTTALFQGLGRSRSLQAIVVNNVRLASEEAGSAVLHLKDVPLQTLALGVETLPSPDALFLSIANSLADFPCLANLFFCPLGGVSDGVMAALVANIPGCPRLQSVKVYMRATQQSYRALGDTVGLRNGEGRPVFFGAIMVKQVE